MYRASAWLPAGPSEIRVFTGSAVLAGAQIRGLRRRRLAVALANCVLVPFVCPRAAPDFSLPSPGRLPIGTPTLRLRARCWQTVYIQNAFERKPPHPPRGLAASPSTIMAGQGQQGRPLGRIHAGSKDGGGGRGYELVRIRAGINSTTRPDAQEWASGHLRCKI